MFSYLAWYIHYKDGTAYSVHILAITDLVNAYGSVQADNK